MKIAGIDGCRAGWLVVMNEAGAYSYTLFTHFNQLLGEVPDLERILIDIPIGLSSKTHQRTIDQKLRKELPDRASTVFNAPCRLAVYELDNELARKYNQEVEGKSLSIQSLNIRDKIREVDVCLAQKRKGPTIFESHPEVCFKYLNAGVVVQTSKATSEGIYQRLKILNSYDVRLPSLYAEILASTKRRDVKKDDIVDAICLCLVNKLGRDQQLQFLTDHHRFDERDIAMKIAYFRKL